MLKPRSKSNDLLADIRYSVIALRYLLKWDAVRILNFQRVLNRLFFTIVQTKLLPLSINTMNWPTREDSLIHNCTPVGRIFSLSIRVLGNNIKDFHDFSDCKFSSTKRDYLVVLALYLLLYEGSWGLQSFLSYTIGYPTARKYIAFTEFSLQKGFTGWIGIGVNRPYLETATLYDMYADASMAFYKFSDLQSAGSVRYIEEQWDLSNNG